MTARLWASWDAPSDRDYASGLGYDEPARICDDCDELEAECVCGPLADGVRAHIFVPGGYLEAEDWCALCSCDRDHPLHLVRGAA